MVVNIIPSGTALTATGTTTAQTIRVPDFDSLTFKLQVTAVSGTTPTLDMYVQTSDNGGTTFYDMVHFSQITASSANPVWASVAAIDAGRVIGSVGSKTVSAGSVGVPLLAPVIQAAYTLGGTTPSFTVQLDALINTFERGY